MRRQFRALLAFCLAMFLTLSLSVAAVAAEPEATPQEGAYDGYIVKLRQNGDQAVLMAAEDQEILLPLWPEMGYYRVNSLEEVSRLAYGDLVELAEPDYQAELLDVPNDSYYQANSPTNQQWNLDAIGMKYAWENGLTGAGVTVAVIDSGLRPTHDDLPEHVLPGRYYYYVRDDVNGTVTFGDREGKYLPMSSDDTTDSSDISHGSMVAGIIAAKTNNRKGIAGVAPGVNLMPIRCFTYVEGEISGYTSNLALGIKYAIDQGADIINMSWGVKSHTTILSDMTDAAAERGIIMVAAVGNDGAGNYKYPAAYDNVIGVGATDKDGNIASYSQRNDTVMVVAPGGTTVDHGRIISLSGKSDTGYVSNVGTSFAAPMVTGAIALLLEQKPETTPGQCALLLQSTSTPLTDKGLYNQYSGYGLIHVQKLLGGYQEPTSHAECRLVKGEEGVPDQLVVSADFYLGGEFTPGEDYQLICAAYDTHGHFITNAAATKTTANGEIAAVFQFERLKDLSRFRVFLLDGATLAPLANSAECTYYPD